MAFAMTRNSGEKDGVVVREDKPLISVRRLNKVYVQGSRRICVLTNLALTVEQGEMIGVIGASGVGKTTLLQVLGTLDQPTDGAVLYDGVNPFTLPDRHRAQFRRRHIGFVFQFHHLLPQFTALENVMMPLMIDRQPRAAAHERAVDLLQRMGLSHRLTHRPSELSGGEQQRVALARALVMQPRVILADEPTGNLDVNTSQGIHDLLFELNEEFDTAMIVVTHNPTLAQRMPRQLRLHEGSLHPVEEAQRLEEVSP